MSLSELRLAKPVGDRDAAMLALYISLKVRPAEKDEESCTESQISLENLGCAVGDLGHCQPRVANQRRLVLRPYRPTKSRKKRLPS